MIDNLKLDDKMFLNEEPKEEKIIKIINELEYNNKEDDYKNEKTERYININIFRG